MSRFVKRHSGIVLDESKAYLVQSRLAPIMEELGFESYAELYEKARLNPDLATRLIDAITTNETSFFRDKRPFDFFSGKLLPEFAAVFRGGNQIRIWSAACSSGQETYSLAMLVREFLAGRVDAPSFQIIGTDIANSVLQQAREGRYSRHEIVRGMPAHFLAKYFRRDGDFFIINDELRSMTSFQKINLLNPLVTFGKYDVIFCRNVAIYFSIEDRRILFNRLAERLQPGGVLFIGATESLFGVTDRFVRKQWNQTVYYQLHPGGSRGEREKERR